MKRLINARIPVIFACAVAIGAATGLLFCYQNLDIFWLFAVVPLAALLTVLFLLIRKPKLLLLSAAVIFIFTGAFFNGYAKIKKYEVCDTDKTATYYVTGRVVDKGVYGENEYLILDDAAADGKNLSGKIRVYLAKAYGDYCEIGYSVEFYSKLSAYDAFTYGKLNYNVENNVKYSCSVNGGLKSEYGFSLFGSARSALRDTLYDNLDSETAAVCYAMLLGNTQCVDDEIMQSFRYGGVAHIFAVSGLHVGLVFGILNAILKRLFINKFLSATLCVAAIVFYAGVCGFTLSSLRAVIMCTVTLITRLFHLKRDGLNSLALAVIIILSITPLSLFSVGFQLSVCAVGGIYLCSGTFNKLLKKTKLPANITGAVSTSFGAQLGTFPIMLSSFGYVSGAGLILNLIVLPVISVFFVFIFVAVIIGTVIPPLGIAVTFAVIPLEGVLSFLLSLGFEKALITGFGNGAFIPVYYIALLFLSDKLNINNIVRIISVFLFAAALAAVVLISANAPFNGYGVYVSASYNGGNVILKSPQGTVVIMTESAESCYVIASLNENYAKKPDGLIILGGETCAESYDPELGCKNVYISNLYLPVQPFGDAKFNYESRFTLCGIDFEFIDGYNVVCGLGGVTVGVSAGEIKVDNCNLLISSELNYDAETHETICNAEKTVYFSQQGYRYNVYEYGCLKYLIKDGEINFLKKPREI